ncbi:MAG: acylneuraminate cytidylyltransferase, partial [Anaerolineaceae bacterium]
LIAYSIAAGLQAQTVTRVIVSTDDEEIAAVARQWGAEVPFLRPAELAQDDTPDYPVFRHALGWLAEHEGYLPQVVVQLRPTSPVRPLTCVDNAVNLLLAHPEVDCVRGVVPSGQNPFKMWTIAASTGKMVPLLRVEGIKEPYNAPRQILPDTYWQTGHIDAIRSQTIFEKGSLTGDVIMPLIINPQYTVDIDLPSDWISSERVLLERGLRAVDPLKARRSFPQKVSVLVMDFDGVLSNDLVHTDQYGNESVTTSRSDGLGLDFLRDQGSVKVMILSREENPVVAARGKKLKLEVFQAVDKKDLALRKIITERGYRPEEIIYVGNDITDLAALPLVGFFATPSDANPEVLRRADLVLSKPGGHGAIRELCDMILAHLGT